MATGEKTRKKKSSGNTALRNVVGSALGNDALVDLVERLGLVDMVLDRVKSKFEETEIDDLFEEVTAYLKRNPEVLVVSLGALTVATGLLVYLNNQREWDGTERRRTASATARTPAAASTGRVRKSA